MRRLVIEEPVSRAAVAGWRIGLFSLPVFLAGIVLVRSGSAEFGAGLAVAGAACVLASAAAALAVAALSRIWREGRRGLGQAIRALLVAAAVLAYPGFLAARLVFAPYYADLSTDLTRPPAFSRSAAAMDARGGRMPEAPDFRVVAFEVPVRLFPDGAALRQAQRRRLPDLVSRRTDLSADVIFARSLEIAQAEGWRIVDSSPPGGRFGMGHLDVVRTTGILKLPVDMTVRLRIHAEGTTIDVRSVPRYPLFDAGTGPRSIQRFLEGVAPEEGVPRG
ncbi:MAG: DUF1499 domain-containing protein [Pseudochelatococcus sp.]|jgi:hypothetical protein|uniref:DUF1499 domain-containing protein n=1 Tax=Pseudochelatococcus sp. TaxID=2020869 RepID=UPI003D8CADB5